MPQKILGQTDIKLPTFTHIKDDQSNKQLKDEDDEEGGAEGAGGLLWQAEGLEASLLPSERANLLEKIVRGFIIEGHTNFGPKDLKKMLSQAAKEKKIQHEINHAKSHSNSGSNVPEHPLLKKKQGLNVPINPSKQSDKNRAEAANKNKNKLNLTPGMKAKATPKAKYVIKQEHKLKEVPKFNPKPNGSM